MLYKGHSHPSQSLEFTPVNLLIASSKGETLMFSHVLPVCSTGVNEL